MNEPVKVTLVQLRDYLLTQRSDKLIEMTTGINDGPGCLMTQYGRDHEFTFNYSNSTERKWTYCDDYGYHVEAVLDGYVFDLFFNHKDKEFKAAKQIASRYSRNTCGYWQDMLKDKTNK